MHDKPFKDGRAVSWQAHEIDRVQKQAKKEIPCIRTQQVQSAIDRPMQALYSAIRGTGETDGQHPRKTPVTPIA